MFGSASRVTPCQLEQPGVLQLGQAQGRVPWRRTHQRAPAGQGPGLPNRRESISGDVRLCMGNIFDGGPAWTTAALHKVCMTRCVKPSQNRDSCQLRGVLKRAGCKMTLTCGLGGDSSQQGCCQHQDGLQEEVHGDDVCLGQVHTCSSSKNHLEAALEANDAALE